MKYYRLLDKLNIRNRWFLGEVYSSKKVNIWNYISIKNSKLDSNQKLVMDIIENGEALDFTFSAFDVPIVSERIKSILDDEEVFFIPINIKKSKENFYILVIKKYIDAVDSDLSDFLLWEENNKIRPDLAGTYKVFKKLIVDGNKTESSNIFRIENYEIALIISEDIMKKFKKYKITGIDYKCVSCLD